MDQATIQRYQAGGDIYNQLAAEYGTSAANSIASAALTGDETQVNAAIVTAQFGAPLDTSTADAFASQIENNVLAAPLSSLNSQISAAFSSLFSNPWVVVALVAGLFFFFGGGSWLKGMFNKK